MYCMSLTNFFPYSIFYHFKSEINEYVNNTVSLRSDAISRKFCYAESESGGQIGLSRQDFKKMKLNLLKRMILVILF